MMGRAAYQSRGGCCKADALLYGEPAPFASPEGGRASLDSVHRARTRQGRALHAITCHVLGLFRAVPGARAFRRHLAVEAVKPGASAAVMADALALVLDRQADLSHIAA